MKKISRYLKDYNLLWAKTAFVNYFNVWLNILEWFSFCSYCRQYCSKFDRTSCYSSDNVCWDIKKWYLFLLSVISLFDVTLTNNFQYQSQFLDTDNTALPWYNWKIVDGGINHPYPQYIHFDSAIINIKYLK